MKTKVSNLRAGRQRGKQITVVREHVRASEVRWACILKVQSNPTGEGAELRGELRASSNTLESSTYQSTQWVYAQSKTELRINPSFG